MNENTERIESPTPNGGAYAIIYYQNAAGEPVAKSKAVKAEIFEFNKNDKLIQINFIEFSGIQPD